MTLNQFKDTLSNDSPPPDISRPLQVMWHAAKDDWDGAHKLTQGTDDQTIAWTHAYLHRVEGDISNAKYWYSRAGRDMPNKTLEEEWESIVEALM